MSNEVPKNASEVPKDSDASSIISKDNASTALPPSSEAGSELGVMLDEWVKDCKLNLGAKLIPELGAMGFHVLQLLCDKTVRSILFSPISENRDQPKMPLIAILDADEKAQLIGYAKMLQEHIKAYMKRLEKENIEANEELLRIAFLEILEPFSDADNLQAKLPSITSILMKFLT